MGPDLFNSTTPPAVWVTIHAPETGEHNEREVSVRVQQTGRKSVSWRGTLDRYSPEWSFFRAVAGAMESVDTMQRPLTRGLLAEAMTAAVSRWVEPF